MLPDWVSAAPFSRSRLCICLSGLFSSLISPFPPLPCCVSSSFLPTSLFPLLPRPLPHPRSPTPSSPFIPPPPLPPLRGSTVSYCHAVDSCGSPFPSLFLHCFLLPSIPSPRSCLLGLRAHLLQPCPVNSAPPRSVSVPSLISHRSDFIDSLGSFLSCNLPYGFAGFAPRASGSGCISQPAHRRRIEESLLVNQVV